MRFPKKECDMLLKGLDLYNNPVIMKLVKKTVVALYTKIFWLHITLQDPDETTVLLYFKTLYIPVINLQNKPIILSSF